MAELQRSQRPSFTVHDRLRKAREVAGLEQAELAERIEVDRGSVSNYETGKTTRLKRPVLRRWALACDVDLDWLAYGIEQNGPTDPSEQVKRSSPWMTDEPLASVHTLKVAV